MNYTKRKVVWDRGGVSEVIGTILTLSITVVLFSSIISMVNQFPAPGDNVYTDFTATIEPINDWTDGAFIHITNTGGEQMTGLWTVIAVTVDDYTCILNTQGTLDGITYGLGPGVYGHKGNDNGDENWDTGERWTLFRNETQIGHASDISVMVLDQERNALVWNADIQGESNVFGPIISEIRVDSDLRSLRSDPIQFGRNFYIFARVYDPDGDLDAASVIADLTSILPGAANASIPMTDADGDGMFMGGPIMGPNANDVPIGYHIALVKASDLSGKKSVGSGRISVGMDLGGQPNLRIRSTDISVKPQSPINGQTVSVAATVKNYGGWCNGYVMFYDIVGTNIDTIGMMNFTMSQGPAQVTRSVSWMARPGGEHMIRAEAVPYGVNDITPEDNYNYTNITVLPKILLVDDDNHPADLSESDTVSYMRGALESSDFGYDLYTVGPNKDGPGYDLGQTKMEDYDVIIWMTGYERTRTLTGFDQTNITYFLNDEAAHGRGGSLWMIGQYIFEDPAIPNSFFGDNLKVAARNQFSGGPTNPLMGVTGNPVSFQWNSTFIPVMIRVAGENYSYSIQPSAGAEITFRDTVVNSTYGDAINYKNVTKDSRIVFFPWEFSRIVRTSDQTQIAYRVLKWLGNITLRHGEDLAVSEQVLAPSFVFFNQIVHVDAQIRNNGENNLTAQVGLFLDGKNEPEAWVPSLDVPGKGGSVTVAANWTARQLGVHVLKWRVDPNNLIAETNEGNNEIPDYISSGEVFVEFRILVVDDDGSPNNNGLYDNDTAYITDSLTRLGYTYESPNGVNTTYVVDSGANGPSIDILMQYSSVIWMTGANLSGLNAADSYSLEAYVNNYQGLLWLAGNDLWSGIPGANITSDMGIDTVTQDLNLAGTLRGVDDSPISHGMNVSVRTNPVVDTLTPLAGAYGVFYQSYMAGRYCALMYDGGSYKGFTMALNLSTMYGSQTGYLSGNEALDELTYIVLHWMDKPDQRSEVRITERDYYVSDWHPQIGGAYIIRANVHNVGSGEANVLVRFMDGTTQIGADTISISPDGQTSAELIWRPLFAGQRDIGILVDPVNDVDEIFQWFNNNRTFSIYVYFFWDDMESGSGKWSHYSTILHISGEGALDFMTGSYTSLYTDVVGDLDWNRCSGVQNSTDQAHSHPNSFYMEEVSGGTTVVQSRPPIDVVFALDNSGSMGGTPLANLKVATMNFIANLTDQDRAAIWIFNNQPNPVILRYYTYMTAANRASFNTSINGINDLGYTPFYDTLGSAIQYSIVNASTSLAYVIGMTDGESNSDDVYTPEANWESPYTGTDPQNYANGGDTTAGNGFTGGTGYGLIIPPVMVYTIGLGITHDPAYPSAPGWSRTAPGAGYPIEYDIWHCADSSPYPTHDAGGAYGENATTGDDNVGHYYYTTDSSQLPSIFQDIFTSISIGTIESQNQTRSTPALPVPNAGNSNKSASSPAIDISNYTSAKLSFWTKYNMVSGGNGGVIGVEVWDVADSEWKFLYIIPPGAYTGGLYYGYSAYDDFMNPIKWCFNGISGGNTFDWDYISVDILPLIPAQYWSNVRLAFRYIQYGGGSGVGWFIDDIQLDVSRADASTINPNTKDIWELSNTEPHSGSYSWSNVDPVTNEIRTGIDNSLITQPIDLTNARNVYLSAYFKFNFNQNSGAPPDGFRVEISSNGGATWTTLNLGIRSSWGVSGTGLDAEDGAAGDGKTYTGFGDSGEGNYATDGYWVSAGTLSRLNIDISLWSGHQIILRFRMVTNNIVDGTYPHTNNAVLPPSPLFAGFYVDDVNVYGETIFS